MKKSNQYFVLILVLSLFLLIFLLIFINSKIKQSSAVSSSDSKYRQNFVYESLEDYAKNEGLKSIPIYIKESQYNIFIADSDILRNRGLGYLNSMQSNEGMIFVFQEMGQYSFWMKGMKFNLDIVWLDESKNIIGIEENISPDTFPKNFGPDNNSIYVLELLSGEVSKNNLQIGDKLDFDFSTV